MHFNSFKNAQLYQLLMHLLYNNGFAWSFLHTSFSGVWDNNRQFYFGLFLSWLVFISIMGIYVLIELIVRLLCIPFRMKKEHKIPSRRRFISLIGMGIASIPFMGMLYGMFKGKYDFRVIKYTLFFDNLPEIFDGYRIIHISDIHSGSFDNPEKVQYGIDMINAQEGDAIFFTGDLVNNKATEMDEWINHFKQLKAKDGIYSVLGNHDYGDYVQWNTPEEKEKNLEDLKKIHHNIGFYLLNNESVYISRNGYRLAVIGVENWGRDFIKRGDLDEAIKGVPENDFKILLSHDPTYFEYKVIDYPVYIPLTLSGHTHGMQFGIEIPGFIKWSPASWKYKYWGGIYKVKNKFINVNRGFGYLAFPGRVGMPPEISVIELKKKK